MKKSLKNKLDEAFSLYVRLRDTSKSGLGKCCTCGRMVAWNRADAGHYIPRQYFATRWHEHNVHLQCKHCNAFMGGRMDAHKEFILRKHGETVLAMLEFKLSNEKRVALKMYDFEIEAMIKDFKEKIHELKKSKSF